EISNRTLARDLENKVVTYARNGIPEYWVIDLQNNKLIVHTNPKNDTYAQVLEYKVGAVSPLAFPQITVSLELLLLYYGSVTVNCDRLRFYFLK
ncbi:MAG: Uma2 family endonuclease, partial [Bacteroidota bacterium]